MATAESKRRAVPHRREIARDRAGPAPGMSVRPYTYGDRRPEVLATAPGSEGTMREMKRLTTAVLALALVLPLGGCIIHTDSSPRSAKRGSRCHPSQYWDGHRCRHKGKGKGARKHDGRRR